MQGVALGEHSRVTVGGIIFCVRTGRVSERPAQKIDIGCNEDGGYTTKARGQRDLVVTAEMQYRRANNPSRNPPNLQAGEDTPTVQVWPDFDNDPAAVYTLPVGYCESCEVDLDGVGVQTYRVQIENQGGFTTPARPVL